MTIAILKAIDSLDGKVSLYAVRSCDKRIAVKEYEMENDPWLDGNHFMRCEWMFSACERVDDVQGDIKLLKVYPS